MTVMLVAGLVLMGVSAALLGRAFTLSRARTAQTIEKIGVYGFSVPAADAPAEESYSERLARRLGDSAARYVGEIREGEMRAELLAAGIYGLTPRKFLGYRVLCTLVVPVVLMYSLAALRAPGPVLLVAGVCAALAGWIAPATVVRKRKERRFAEVEGELPELIDLLVVTVEAGLGFTGSLQVASSRTRGPLSDELRLVLQEQNMGLSMEEALRNMLARCETPAMRGFVRSVLQGEMLGVSIGQIMRNLSDEMRKRRRAAAEEQAQKAPIKILFPLVFLIFPAMFIVLLSPAAFSLLSSLSSQ
jgi:tight adherence protein C